MNRANILLAVALMAMSAPARAGTISLPLSLDGGLVTPRLETKKLTPAARKDVEEAVATARRASQAALAAEDMVQAATKAQGDAEKKVPGHGTLDVSPHCRYRGEVIDGHASGAGVMHCGTQIFAGRFRDGRLEGLGGDYSLNTPDAYEGTYRDGARAGLGVERDKDGFYPGFYGVAQGARGRKINLELLGVQNFKNAHWAGRFGFYGGPKIACSLIKGAVLEGSVLNGPGAKFNRQGQLIEQGFYRMGLLQGGSGPPC